MTIDGFNCSHADRTTTIHPPLHLLRLACTPLLPLLCVLVCVSAGQQFVSNQLLLVRYG